MAIHPITYLELPATDTEPMKAFYGAAFGWSFEDFGPEYATFHHAGIEGGFNATGEGQPKAPLAVINTTQIDTMEKVVTDAGGKITVPTFAFPGGRRFHFTDPHGNELAVMQADS